MVRFGVAGYPPAFHKSVYKRDRIKILNWLDDLGLDALELQMTYGPRTKKETCLEYSNVSSELGISLSVHASYFIVLTSDDPGKLDNSRETLKKTFELSNYLGSKKIILHPGSLYKIDSNIILERLIKNLSSVMNDIGKSDIGLFLETAGKVGQLGSVNEILEICKNIQGVFPCIDFGHVHARTLGSLDTEDSVTSILNQIEKAGYLKNPNEVHFHYTPIDYGSRGEIVHKAIDDKYPEESQMFLPGFDVNNCRSKDGFYYPRHEHVASSLKKFSLDCTVISETHNSQEVGAIALKKSYEDS